MTHLAHLASQTFFLPTPTNDISIGVQHALATFCDEGFKIQAIRHKEKVFHTLNEVTSSIVSSIGKKYFQVKKYLFWHIGTLYDRSGKPCSIEFCIEYFGSRGGYKGLTFISFDLWG